MLRYIYIQFIYIYIYKLRELQVCSAPSKRGNIEYYFFKTDAELRS